MRKIKSVAFNIADPYELKMINHLHQYPNFSSYIKRLIQRDMEGGNVATIEDKKEDHSDLMKGML